VPLVDNAVAIGLLRAGSLRELDRLRAEPHRAAHVALPGDDVLLVGHRGDDRRTALFELAGVRVLDAREVYGSSYVEERHRHRYEVNNQYRDQLQQAGLVFSGTSPDGHLVEYVELPRDVHPYFVATQAHPEFRSRPARAHPLFAGLVAAAIGQKSGATTVDLTAVSAGTA
jgi:CTP synthase